MAVRKVVVTLPEELYGLVERACAVERRTRSEVIQEALRTHFGEAVYTPTEEERSLLLRALDADRIQPGEIRILRVLHDRRDPAGAPGQE